jgi:hypothetical protein
MTIGNEPRLASEAPFPYAAKRVCLLAVTADGPRQLHYKADVEAAIRRALLGELTLMAVWPGEYKSDLFVIDNVEALAVARGVS